MSESVGVSRRVIVTMALAAAATPVVLRAASPHHRHGRARAYRAIRYARAQRFEAAEMLPFEERLIGTVRGPVAPQFPSRLAFAMGAQAPLLQDEHCQYLSVFTPDRTGRRPVIIFLHGGAYVSGGGELPWHDGDMLSAEQDVVVVSVTYRLGALGYRLDQGSTGPSPGMTDQIAALRWIKANIDRFGGDPANVTLVGQSAGSASAMQLVEWGHGGDLFQRIVGMSAYRLRGERGVIEASSRAFDGLISGDPRSAPVEAILAAQKQIPINAADRELTWQPAAPDEKAVINVDVLTGWTREDPSVGMVLADGGKRQPGAALLPFREANKRLIGLTSDYAAEVAAARRTAFLYSFDWNGPDTGLGNCHCIDLSFLFGDRSAWEGAPMLAATDWKDHDRLARAMRAQWAAFARSGDPNAAREAQWTPVSANAAPVTSLA